MIRILLVALFLSSVLLFTPQIWAQSRTRPTNPHCVAWDTMEYYDVSLTFGRFLPFGVVGVKDNYPMWGVMASHPSPLGQVEYQFYSAKAEGVTLL